MFQPGDIIVREDGAVFSSGNLKATVCHINHHDLDPRLDKIYLRETGRFVFRKDLRVIEEAFVYDDEAII